MKNLVLLLSTGLICLHIVTVFGQNDIEKVNKIITELESEGGEFNEFDFERFSEISNELFSLTAKHIQAKRENLNIEDLYKNETLFIWRSMDFGENQMYLMYTSKEFAEVNSVNITFREAYLVSMALNNLQAEELKTPE